MRRLVLAWAFGVLLLAANGYALDEKRPDEITPIGQLSEDEKQLLEILEMLQNYDLLDEIDVLSVMEEDQ